MYDFALQTKIMLLAVYVTEQSVVNKNCVEILKIYREEGGMNNFCFSYTRNKLLAARGKETEGLLGPKNIAYQLMPKENPQSAQKIN